MPSKPSGGLMADHLSLPLRLPDEDHQRYERLAALTRSVANHVLHNHWTPTDLDGVQAFSYQAWKYFDEHEAFAALALYLPSRIRRCILQKVGETLRSQADRRSAFHAIQPDLPEHKIRRIHRRRIKRQLWADREYLPSGYVDILIDQLNSYYDRHGHFPETYVELQACPEYSSGVLPYSADDGPTAGQAVRYDYDADSTTQTVQLKTPDTLSPQTRGEWSWTEYELDGYDAFAELCSHGELSAPEFQPTRRKMGTAFYELSFPVEINHPEPSDETECVLALDAGIRKEMTAVVVSEAGEQLSRPPFRPIHRAGEDALSSPRAPAAERPPGRASSRRSWAYRYVRPRAKRVRAGERQTHAQTRATRPRRGESGPRAGAGVRGRRDRSRRPPIALTTAW